MHNRPPLSERTSKKMEVDDDIHLDGNRPSVFPGWFEAPGAYGFDGFLIQTHSQRPNNQQIVCMSIGPDCRQQSNFTLVLYSAGFF
jgi:hypothetical protein